MNWLLPAAAGFVFGIISGFGIGGGTLLMLYLTLFAGFDQQSAQSINLLYFLPTASAALLLHAKNKLLDWKTAIPAALCGCVTAAASAWLAAKMDTSLLRKCFGVFLILIAFLELRKKAQDTD